jgi:protein-S-isoprenylcysteine O-methyltransferase Ste14
MASRRQASAGRWGAPINPTSTWEPMTATGTGHTVIARVGVHQQGERQGGWRTRLTGVSAVGVFVIAVVLRVGSLAVHSVILSAIGAVLFACGIALAVWARLYLGRNLTATFPTAYPEYKSRTKMLIPFLL